MFLTNEGFKCRVQFDPDSIAYRSVELSIHAPWFICSFWDKAGGIYRNLLVSSLQDLVLSTKGDPNKASKRYSLILIQPPFYSATKQWQTVPLRQVATSIPTVDESPDDLVMVAKSGERFSEFPCKSIEGDIGKLTPVLKFR